MCTELLNTILCEVRTNSRAFLEVLMFVSPVCAWSGQMYLFGLYVGGIVES